MSNLNDNTIAVSRQIGDRAHDLITHFQEYRTWEEFGPGGNEGWLEQMKMDLTNLATMVEQRIQEIRPVSPQDFG